MYVSDCLPTLPPATVRPTSAGVHFRQQRSGNLLKRKRQPSAETRIIFISGSIAKSEITVGIPSILRRPFYLPVSDAIDNNMFEKEVGLLEPLICYP